MFIHSYPVGVYLYTNFVPAHNNATRRMQVADQLFPQRERSSRSWRLADLTHLTEATSKCWSTNKRKRWTLHTSWTLFPRTKHPEKHTHPLFEMYTAWKAPRNSGKVNHPEINIVLWKYPLLTFLESLAHCFEEIVNCQMDTVAPHLCTSNKKCLNFQPFIFIFHLRSPQGTSVVFLWLMCTHAHSRKSFPQKAKLPI